MPDPALSWRERLREWSWPWFPIFAASIVVFSAWLYLFLLQERVERAECKRLYELARTGSDTLVVDGIVPFHEAGRPYRAVTCGERRRLGQRA